MMTSTTTMSGENAWGRRGQRVHRHLGNRDNDGEIEHGYQRSPWRTSYEKLGFELTHPAQIMEHETYYGSAGGFCNFYSYIRLRKSLLAVWMMEWGQYCKDWKCHWIGNGENAEHHLYLPDIFSVSYSGGKMRREKVENVLHEHCAKKWKNFFFFSFVTARIHHQLDEPAILSI